MRCRAIRAAIAVAAVLLACGCTQSGSGFVSKYESKSLPKIKPPRVKEQVLPSGMRAYLLEDHTLPVVKVGVITKAGGIYEPADEVGLALLTGIMMRSGGAGGKTPEEFDSALDQLGARLRSSIDKEMGKANLEVLSGDLDEGLGLLFDMLFKPTFDEQRLAVAKQKVLESLRRQDDDPQSLANYKFKQMVYGKDSPWARRPDRKSLAGIDRSDIDAFHRKYFRTDNMIFTAAGDFDADELIAAIEKLVAGAPKGKVDFPKVEPVKLEFRSEFEGVARPLTQSFIRMGHLSIRRHNPEKYALFLVDDVLGASGFMSRLVKDVRAKRGLAYSIWSTVSIGTDYGTFSIGVNTKAANAELVIGMVKEHLERIAVKGDITKEELDLAKQSILARLIFQFDSPFKVVNQEARFHFYGYPKDYWRIYRDRIASTTLEEVKAAAKKYLKPDDLEILIVGPKKSFPKGR
jgi:predicted Zn-dependent peptidase